MYEEFIFSLSIDLVNLKFKYFIQNHTNLIVERIIPISKKNIRNPNFEEFTQLSLNDLLA